MSAQIIAGMVLGALAGLALGPAAAPFGELGKLVIQLIKAAATPLLFLAVVQAILEADLDLAGGAKMVAVACFNACVALAIGLGISNLIEPGRYLQSMAGLETMANGSGISSGSIDLLKTLASYIPSNFVQPFAENLIIPMVLIALLLGFALRRVRKEQIAKGLSHYRAVEDAILSLYRVMEIILHS